MAYTTLDYLPDLTATEVVNARSLSFTYAPVPSVGWDYKAEVYGSESYALLHDLYRFNAIAGATYDIFSTSYFDPYLLRLYDNLGNTIVANDESDDGTDVFLVDAYYSQDVIFNWVAPYSGTYYVAANWHQGAYFKFYSLTLHEDRDTITTVGITPPTVPTSSPVDDYNANHLGTVLVGGSASGNIEVPDDIDYFNVELVGGRIYRFDLEGAPTGQGSLSDPWIAITGSGGGTANDDDSGVGLNASINNFTPNRSGSYLLGASTLTNGTGTYRISATDITIVPSDTTAPFISTFSPADEATNIAIGSNIVITFSEAIQRGVGNIVLKTATGTTVATFDAATQTNLNLMVLGSTVTINPTADLAYSTEYKLEFAAGTIKDLAGNSYAGTTSYNFTTMANPITVPIVTPLVQVFSGSGFNDVFSSTSGNDTISGGAGIDTVLYRGNHGNYTQYNSASGRVITDGTAGRDGADTLISIERVQFSDGVLAFDNLRTDIPGKGYLLYRAAFDRAPDAAGLGYWIRQLDQGADYAGMVAASFIASPEFIAKYGSNTSNLDFLNLVYQNVLDRAPDQGGSDYWLGQLNNGYSRANLLASFAVSDENYNSVAPLISNGIWFV